MSFHVPEQYRIKTGRQASDASFGNNGAFSLPSVISTHQLFIIASDGSNWEACGLPGEPWEHVSVHCEDGRRVRVPTWIEMCQIKDLFWDDDDVVIQFHPRKSEYVNNHEATLHLWRPTVTAIPTPPSITVGYKSLDPSQFKKALALAFQSSRRA